MANFDSLRIAVWMIFAFGGFSFLDKGSWKELCLFYDIKYTSHEGLRVDTKYAPRWRLIHQVSISYLSMWSLRRIREVHVWTLLPFGWSEPPCVWDLEGHESRKAKKVPECNTVSDHLHIIWKNLPVYI